MITTFFSATNETAENINKYIYIFKMAFLIQICNALVSQMANTYIYNHKTTFT